MSKDEKEDVFSEAARLSIETIEKNKSLEEAKRKELLNKAKEIAESNDPYWDELAKAVEGRFTKRIINIMDNSSDKDFMKYYMKLLEHFKPKLTRTQFEPNDDADKELTIFIKESEVNEIIDITNYTNIIKHEELEQSREESDS